MIRMFPNLRYALPNGKCCGKVPLTSVIHLLNVQRHSGRGGKFTFPDMAKAPCGAGAPLDEFRIDHAGTPVGTAGHLHPGDLYDDLDLIRAGDSPRGGATPGTVPNSVRLFRSEAHYFDKGGPISWDVAMTATPADWRPQANNYHGGTAWVGVDPIALPECATRRVLIAGFRYLPGDCSASGSNRCIPTITRGQSITFVNEDANPFGSFGDPIAPKPFYLQSIFHTVTSCNKPCALSYGISYPLANGTGSFDSGQLGIGTPGVGRLTWSTPTSLKPGNYTFFCRIHPWMRGVFRIIR